MRGTCPNCEQGLLENGCESCEHKTDGTDCMCKHCNRHPIYESMTRFTWFDRLTFRFWCQTPGFERGPHKGILDLMSQWLGGDVERTVHAICKCFPEINAVEVLDQDGNGGLYYPDWP